MASIAREKNGNRRILFVAPDGKRRTVRLGKVSQRTAEGIKFRVEQLVERLVYKQPMDTDLAQWVADLEKPLAKKLAAVGLIQKSAERAATMLGPFLADYIASRTDVKPNTRDHLERAKGDILRFFGEDKSLHEITPGDADEFRLHLLSRLGDNTVRRTCGRAKQLFQAAVRKRIIAVNPFGDMKGCNVQANRDRDFFVTREMANRVLAACPNTEWKLLFALSRFGGLRCPSEHLALRWGDVDWERGRLMVHSPKTEHHEGKEMRQIPLFPELHVHLEAAFDEAAPGTEYVISRYRDKNKNLRTQLQRIIRKAGLTPWPKIWHNLRATRQTELAQIHPIHVVCEWIGNSQAVAAKHYLRVTEADFAQAFAGAAQKAAQQAHVESRNDLQRESASHGNMRELPKDAAPCDVIQDQPAPPVGLEPTTRRLTAACSTN